ncbi:MAG: D-alanine--D-alanine ligase [Kiritimatiellae bacterium]|nr:D-alanine--D-alanine ligase [Kiritimatiellia bacterium]
MKKVCVLMGGTSNERAVSLQSGANVVKALEALGKYEVVPVRLDADSVDAVPACDAAFLALHGGYGENGGVQAALNARGIPYTGPGAAASKLAMDKIETKKALEKAGVPTAAWAVVADPAAPAPLPFPCVVKPPRDGSSVGISKATDEASFRAALAEALKVDGREALVEAYVPGREMTVAVLNGKAFPVVEICAPGGWYGYKEKYLSDETTYPFPDDAFLPEMQRLAVAAYDACGCRGVTRVDFRVTDAGEMFVLELNTVPGMTAHSLVPKAAAKTGLDFPALCDEILASAACD